MAKNLVDGTSTSIEENGNNISIQINFPIGYIYMSTSSTNPSTYFGGQWQRIAKGRTLVGVDENDTDFTSSKMTSGEKTHTLTVDEMPSHKHGAALNTPTTTDFSGQNNWAVKYVADASNTAYITETGGGQAHNNLQPYFTCYIWEKVGA